MRIFRLNTVDIPKIQNESQLLYTIGFEYATIKVEGKFVYFKLAIVWIWINFNVILFESSHLSTNYTSNTILR